MAIGRKDKSIGVNLIGRDVSASKALKNVGKNAKDSGAMMRKMGSIASKSFKAIAAGAAIAAVATFKVAKESVKAASDLAESTSKIGAVFKQTNDAVLEWSRGAAEGFGQSRQAALEAAGTYGNLIQAFGIAEPKAAKMSMRLVELAADLASFNNTSVEEAIEALRSGLSGETEPLKRYGVALNDVRLKEEALRLGLVKTTKGTLPIAIKTQAAYSLILRDTKLAQGDFERTSDGLANQQRILTARFKDASAELGQSLLPIALDLVRALNREVVPAVKTFIDVLTGRKDMEDFGDSMTPLQESAGKLAKAMRRFAEAIGLTNTAAGEASDGPLVKLLNLLTGILDMISAIIEKWKQFDKAIKEMTGADKAQQNRGKNTLGNRVMNPIVELPSWLDWLDPFNIQDRTLQYRRDARGLPQPGARSATVPIPRPTTNVTVNVQGSVVSERELTKQIRDNIAQMMRRQGVNPAALGVGR